MSPCNKNSCNCTAVFFFLFSTHRSIDKIVNILQTTLLNAFSFNKILVFRSWLHWSLFLRIQSTIHHHWFRKWLGAKQRTSQYLNQWWLSEPMHIYDIRPQCINIYASFLWRSLLLYKAHQGHAQQKMALHVWHFIFSTWFTPSGCSNQIGFIENVPQHFTFNCTCDTYNNTSITLTSMNSIRTDIR